MYLAPRYFQITAARFDGTTKPPIPAGAEGPWTPDDLDPNTPRHVLNIETEVGRFNFRALLRPGSAGAVVMVRRWGPAGGSDLISLRSLDAAEVDQLKPPDDPPPADLDVLLETRPLATTWCRPLFAGPTDALTVAWAPAGGGTIEILVAEVADALLAQQVLQVGADADAFTSLEITGAATIGAWSGTLYADVQTPSGATVTLPPLADVEIGATLVYIQTDGSSSLTGDNVETINGRLDMAVPLGTMVIVRRTPFGWAATVCAEATAATTLTNGVAGATLVVTPWTGTRTFIVNFSDWGRIQLPDSALCGSNAEAIFVRPSGDALAAIVPSGTQTINGRTDDLFVPLPGRSVRLRRRIDGNWVLSGEGCEVPVETVGAGDRAFGSAWPGRRILRLTNAALQTVTLPTYTGGPVVPIDCELVVISTGAAGAAVQRADPAELIRGGGANGASVAVATDTVAVFRFTGSEWLSQVA